MDDGSTGSQPLTEEDEEDGEEDMDGMEEDASDWVSASVDPHSLQGDEGSLESVDGAEPIFEQEAIIGVPDAAAEPGWDVSAVVCRADVRWMAMSTTNPSSLTRKSSSWRRKCTTRMTRR